MIAVEEDLASSRVPAGAGGNPLLLKFSADCPMELQELAHQCWHEVPSERPDAIDVQEELVRVLEGRLTVSGQAPPNWTRPSYLSATSALSSLSSSELSSNMSSLPSSCSVMAVSVADL
ncbi:Protein kinase-like domain [Phytophthora cactorum]|nr:Protein kinase-like domain [Phytophthora cactorum]